MGIKRYFIFLCVIFSGYLSGIVHKVINDTVGIVDIVPTVLSQVGVPDPPHGQHEHAR